MNHLVETREKRPGDEVGFHFGEGVVVIIEHLFNTEFLTGEGLRSLLFAMCNYVYKSESIFFNVDRFN